MNNTAEILLPGRFSFAGRYLWQHLRHWKLAGEDFQRQFPLKGYVADFIHLKGRLVIKIIRQSTAARQPQELKWLRQQGYQLLQVCESEVVDRIENVLQAIARRLAASGS